MSVDEGKKRIVIEILGEEYIIRSSSPREHVFEVGKYVNRLMKELCEKYPLMSLQKIAILTALNLASDLLTLRRQEKHRKR
ncbi:MAG: cell division protein ZapA [Dethiobacter sp.]|jgi:cell division protein ZapA|nr:MAG: cell division protein ZapA [Dethiobacter sp.]